MSTIRISVLLKSVENIGNVSDDFYYDLVQKYINDSISIIEFYGDDYITKDAMDYALNGLVKEAATALGQLAQYNEKKITDLKPSILHAIWYKTELRPMMKMIEDWEEMMDYVPYDLADGSAE